MPAEGRARWLWLMLGVIIADRASKLIFERFTPVGFRLEFIPGFAAWVHNRNTGIAFGMFSGSSARWVSLLLAGIAIAITALLVWLIATGRAGGLFGHAGLALIAGGAAGNTIDRLLHGSVTDFLELYAGRFVWPAFNLADAAITVGGILTAWEVLRGERRAHIHS
jgi:signal peptidase II